MCVFYEGTWRGAQAHGDIHLLQKYAKPINAFYQQVFNPWLNLHRRCLFASDSDSVSPKGKVIKRDRQEHVKLPQGALKQRSDQRLARSTPFNGWIQV